MVVVATVRRKRRMCSPHRFVNRGTGSEGGG